MWHICVGVCSTHPPSLNTNKSFRKCLWTASARHSIKLPITNGKDLIHFCNCLNICMRVCVWYIIRLAHTHEKGSVYFFFPPIMFSCLATAFMLWSFPGLMEVAQSAPHFPHLPFLPEPSPFCSCVRLSAAVPAVCSLLKPLPLKQLRWKERWIP